MKKCSLCIAILLISTIVGCNQEPRIMVLPNGEKLELKSIRDLSATHNVEYVQYVGFMATYDDTY